jgi:hypothetical protein
MFFTPPAEARPFGCAEVLARHDNWKAADIFDILPDQRSLLRFPPWRDSARSHRQLAMLGTLRINLSPDTGLPFAYALEQDLVTRLDCTRLQYLDTHRTNTAHNRNLPTLRPFRCWHASNSDGRLRPRGVPAALLPRGVAARCAWPVIVRKTCIHKCWVFLLPSVNSGSCMVKIAILLYHWTLNQFPALASSPAIASSNVAPLQTALSQRALSASSSSPRGKNERPPLAAHSKVALYGPPLIWRKGYVRTKLPATAVDTATRGKRVESFMGRANPR